MKERRGTVFISWSGERSRAVAEILHDVLSTALPHILFRVSSQDLPAGGLWIEGLSRLLEESDFGILCLTTENRNTPWVLFEAGAISKGVGRSRVVPYLLDFSMRDLRFPLAAFQAVSADKGGTHKLFKSVNEAFKAAVDVETLNRIFDTRWPELQARLGAVISAPAPMSPHVEGIPFDSDPALRHSSSNGRLERCLAGELVRFIAITARNIFDPRLRSGEINRFLEGLKRGVRFQGVVLDPCSPQAAERVSVESPGKPKGSSLLETDAAAFREWLNGGYLDHGISEAEMQNLEVRRSGSLISFGALLYSDEVYIEPFHLGKIDKSEHLCGFSILRCPRTTHDYAVVERHFQYLFERGAPLI